MFIGLFLLARHPNAEPLGEKNKSFGRHGVPNHAGFSLSDVPWEPEAAVMVKQNLGSLRRRCGQHLEQSDQPA